METPLAHRAPRTIAPQGRAGDWIGGDPPATTPRCKPHGEGPFVSRCGAQADFPRHGADEGEHKREKEARWRPASPYVLRHDATYVKQISAGPPTGAEAAGSREASAAAPPQRKATVPPTGKRGFLQPELSLQDEAFIWKVSGTLELSTLQIETSHCHPKKPVILAMVISKGKPSKTPLNLKCWRLYS
ncbi:uncharacterized protein LOC110350911 isoform X2 [Heterocephalus glaber]|uniref:Uncharacterized protein LOC110350911 isoform X2 n=1 Tax=Heterocephalus glaber TaxID=10181 RepID=A0AAX6TJ04_HETGA|nr:uncharacterized protein LOC110350911 isoform X2 [Heterocephalus glaber]